MKFSFIFIFLVLISLNFAGATVFVGNSSTSISNGVQIIQPTTTTSSGFFNGSYVPYNNATEDVNLGVRSLTASYVEANQSLIGRNIALVPFDTVSSSRPSYFFNNILGTGVALFSASNGVTLFNLMSFNLSSVSSLVNFTAPNICLSNGTNCPASSGGNASWNESYANTLYVKNSTNQDWGNNNITSNQLRAKSLNIGDYASVSPVISSGEIATFSNTTSIDFSYIRVAPNFNTGALFGFNRSSGQAIIMTLGGTIPVKIGSGGDIDAGQISSDNGYNVQSFGVNVIDSNGYIYVANGFGSGGTTIDNNGVQTNKITATTTDPLYDLKSKANWTAILILDSVIPKEKRGCGTYFDGENSFAWNDITGDWWYGSACGVLANGRVADGNIKPLKPLNATQILNYKNLSVENIKEVALK